MVIVCNRPSDGASRSSDRSATLSIAVTRIVADSSACCATHCCTRQGSTRGERRSSDHCCDNGFHSGHESLQYVGIKTHV